MHGHNETLPDNSSIQTLYQGTLPCDHILPDASNSLVYPGLTNKSLLSIAKFCDNGFHAVFTKTRLYIVKDNKIILQCGRNAKNSLWDIHFNNKHSMIYTFRLTN